MVEDEAVDVDEDECPCCCCESAASVAGPGCDGEAHAAAVNAAARVGTADGWVYREGGCAGCGKAEPEFRVVYRTFEVGSAACNALVHKILLVVDRTDSALPRAKLAQIRRAGVRADFTANNLAGFHFGVASVRASGLDSGGLALLCHLHNASESGAGQAHRVTGACVLGCGAPAVQNTVVGACCMAHYDRTVRQLFTPSTSPRCPPTSHPLTRRRARPTSRPRCSPTLAATPTLPTALPLLEV